MPKLRKRWLVDDWVIIAPERAKRPRRLGLFHGDPNSPSSEGPCPFCASAQALTPPPTASWPSPAFPNHPWGVLAVPNKYPALVDGDPSPVDEPNGCEDLASPGALGPADLYGQRPALGIHEVFIEAPTHLRHWRELSVDHLRAVFGAWRDRLATIAAKGHGGHAIIFKNQGALAGASLPHVHSQLSVLPEPAAPMGEQLSSCRDHYEATGRCALCAILEHEEQRGTRWIAHTPKMAALAPYGSRVPYEVWLAPREHGANFVDIDDEGLQQLAYLCAEILQRWHGALGEIDHNLVLHSIPFDLAGEPYYHWHLEMVPRTSQVAGFEWASRISINAIPSEVAARTLRDLNISLPPTQPNG